MHVLSIPHLMEITVGGFLLEKLVVLYNAKICVPS
jgi:hypothetical protein